MTCVDISTTKCMSIGVNVNLIFMQQNNVTACDRNIGTIPVEIGACQELEFLSISGNKLQGNTAATTTANTTHTAMNTTHTFVVMLEVYCSSTCCSSAVLKDVSA
jgi:hypothetical protein